jgi:Na+/melibiose symporter-like transporter
MFGISSFIWLFSSTLLIGVGLGVMSPAARNAGIQLAPAEAANIAAIRSLGLQMGQIVSIAGATSIIAAANNPSKAHAFVYLGLSAIFLMAITVISRVPENRGGW